jgi:hypothetical protein
MAAVVAAERSLWRVQTKTAEVHWQTVAAKPLLLLAKPAAVHWHLAAAQRQRLQMALPAVAQTLEQ